MLAFYKVYDPAGTFSMVFNYTSRVKIGVFICS